MKVIHSYRENFLSRFWTLFKICSLLCVYGFSAQSAYSEVKVLDQIEVEGQILTYPMIWDSGDFAVLRVQRGLDGVTSHYSILFFNSSGAFLTSHDFESKYVSFRPSVEKNGLSIEAMGGDPLTKKVFTFSTNGLPLSETELGFSSSQDSAQDGDQKTRVDPGFLVFADGLTVEIRSTAPNGDHLYNVYVGKKLVFEAEKEEILWRLEKVDEAHFLALATCFKEKKAIGKVIVFDRAGKVVGKYQTHSVFVQARPLPSGAVIAVSEESSLVFIDPLGHVVDRYRQPNPSYRLGLLGVRLDGSLLISEHELVSQPSLFNAPAYKNAKILVLQYEP